MHSQIEQTIEIAQRAQKAWDEMFSLLRASGLNLDRSYASLQRSTLNELNERMTATFLLADGLRSVEDGGVALLHPRLLGIDASLSNIESHVVQAVAQLQAFAGTTLSDPGGALTVQVSRGGSVITNWGLSGNLDPIAAQQAALFDQLTLSMRFGRYKGIGLFQERARELEQMAADLRNLLDESRPITAALEHALANAKSYVELAQAQALEAENHSEQAASTATAAGQSLAEIEAKLARVKEITRASDALNEQVEDYSTSFTTFQESIDARVAAHSQFEGDMSAALTANKQREADIATLIDMADGMIRGATTAGLSKSLDEARAAYEERLNRTGWWFLGSVVVLMICLLPIAGQLIPGPWQEWFKAPSGGSTDPWLATLGKIVLLLPATWATAFFAGNYAELFHLSREYAHKAAMAKAVDGFKREAPEYKEEIVAGVFMEIRDNPGSRKSPPAATPQNPITTTILEKLLGAIREKKSGP